MYGSPGCGFRHPLDRKDIWLTKKEFLASIIVRTAQWLSARSVRIRLLTDAVVERLFVTEQMVLPAARLRFTSDELIANLDEYNEASERYFADYKDHGYLLGKPYTDTMNFARRLFDIGVLVHWLHLSPGEVLAELGAGTCWLSHFINRFGCRTIAIDISPTALTIGRELFERDPLTNWDLDPQFLPYDGHRLPLPDGHVDKMLVYDAFHHVPNQAEILGEMARVLKPGGIVAMCELGKGHGTSELSKLEMDEWGVLENDIFVEELGQLAVSCGFTDVSVVPVNLPLSVEVPTDRLRGFLQGKELRHYWSQWAQAFQDVNYILLYKGEYVPTMRNPQTARARFEPVRDQVEMHTGEGAELSVRLTNTGDTRWLTAIPDQAGWTRLGGHLHPSERGTPALDYDWYRGELPHDVAPGEAIMVNVRLPAIDTPGRYRVVFDLAVEQVLWFAHRDSPTAELRIDVS